MKKVVLGFVFAVLIFPVMSQTMITVDKDKLATVIKTEVEKQLSTAIDEAVAIAVKDLEKKHVVELAEKDHIITDLKGDIEIKDIQIRALEIQKQNLQIDLTNLKNQANSNYMYISGISLVSGVMISWLISLILP